ncbi:hypothetical protein TBR22_A23400 [Luteitalea sp. TBR-22]|nr:hypothetical protein TBR22_A23400 [Luteitalea sp. TBR-22]
MGVIGGLRVGGVAARRAGGRDVAADRQTRPPPASSRPGEALQRRTRGSAVAPKGMGAAARKGQADERRARTAAATESRGIWTSR